MSVHIRILNLTISELRTFAKGKIINAHKRMTKIQLEDLFSKRQRLKSLYPHQVYTLTTEKNKIEANIIKNLGKLFKLKKEIKAIKDSVIRDIRTFF